MTTDRPEEPKWNIRAILEPTLFQCPALMPVIVGTLIGTRSRITQVYELTKQLTPPEQIAHLRRVHTASDGSTIVILCKVSEPNGTQEEKEAQLESVKLELDKHELLQDYRIIEVPSRAPITEQQRDACAKVWPCKYSKCTFLIGCIDGTIVRLIDRNVLDILADSLERETKQVDELCKFPSGAIIFRRGKIYGVGLTNRELVAGNPTKHAPMLAIDSVARHAGGGYWPAQLEADKLMKDTQGKIDQTSCLAEHRLKQEDPYLCTDYDILISEEPCVMCTMALVQSRIRRVFYLDFSESRKNYRPWTACDQDHSITEFLLHRDMHINHRFQAWRVTPPKPEGSPIT